MRIEVHTRHPLPSPLVEQARWVGVEVDAVDTVRVFFVDGLDAEQAHTLATEILCDDVTETFHLGERPVEAGATVIEVSPKPGVTDAVAETLLGAAPRIGLHPTRAATATRYVLHGARGDLEALATGLLANDVVEQWALGAVEPPYPEGASPVHQVERIDVQLDDEGLLALSNERRLSLDLQEMQCIKAHFTARQPTDLELEMLAQTWSEHCVHKTFRAKIELSVTDGDQVVETRTIDSMLKSFLKVATAKADKDWVRSAFVDNAGIVRFDDELDLALKVETHNHPSALEPFGGANTGVGGCVRDILGVSARPIANTDVLCFGPQDLTDLPAGVLHPRRIAAGVIHGIEDYGNKMGIPTVAGAVVYQHGYTANPLVFAGCLGILPHGSHPTKPQVGDRVVVIGGRTGRDGLRGATFSSMEMSHETHDLAGSAVQIGHPIHEKQVQEVICEARDAGLYTAVTDCGAGGLSSSVGEMASELGATVQLESVPTKYPGLQPWEVWLSEAQERMVLAVPDASYDALLAICARHDVEATSIGRFTGDGLLTVKHGENVVGELDVHFLHDGVPQRQMVATAPLVKGSEQEFTLEEPAGALLALLASPNLRSREDVIRRYDHEVQGGTVVKPLVGVDGHGPGNGTVLVPLAARQAGRTQRGVALGCGINPRYGALDPYAMAWAVLDEAVRNVVVVGGDPDQLSLVDNFCWGNPRLPDRLGALVRCGEGCRDASIAYGAPWISGKDSLNNEYVGADGEKHAIPGTLLVHAMAIVPDITKTATSDLKEPENLVLLVGENRGELGGSALFALLGVDGDMAPEPVEGLAYARGVHRALQTGLVRSAHDVSEGGIAVAVAEMAIGGQLGVKLELSDPRELFCESNARYLLTVRPADLEEVQDALGDVPNVVIGSVEGEHIVLGELLTVTVDEATEAHCG